MDEGRDGMGPLTHRSSKSVIPKQQESLSVKWGWGCDGVLLGRECWRDRLAFNQLSCGVKVPNCSSVLPASL